jgi:hypothetical protein
LVLSDDRSFVVVDRRSESSSDDDDNFTRVYAIPNRNFLIRAHNSFLVAQAR